MALPSLTITHISIPVQLPGNDRLKFYSTEILLYLLQNSGPRAYTYLYVCSDIPSKRCFAFYLVLLYIYGQTGYVATLARKGSQSLPQPIGKTLLLLS